jgi:cytochrome c553
MRCKPASVAALGAAACFLAPLAAQPATDINNGRAVVVGAGLAQGGVACLSCHGVNGAGDGTAAFPRLTSQPAWYLYKQLKDYAAGTRPNDIMSPIAKALDDQQMQDVAAYYEQQQAPYARLPEVDGLTLQQGAALSAVGSAERGIQACVNCHGPAGTGMPPSYPYLAGQYAAYSELQLRLWQEGTRNNDPANVMETIAKLMTPEDIRAVSLYFESVRPPLPDRQGLPGAP